jgi:GNAT superfamily N-acetyltransferase
MDPSINSLVWATDVDVLEQGHVLERREGYWVVRSPTNPTFWWGNFLLFDEAPAPGDGDRWEALFDLEFVATSDVKHRTLAWDRTDGVTGDAEAELTARGYEIERSTGLVALPAEIQPHPRANSDLVVRVLDPDGDEQFWEQVIAVQIEQDAGHFEDLEYHREFTKRRQHNLRGLFRAGRGDWYVAVLGDEVIGSLGIVVTGRRARYQTVDTVEVHRRKGVASRLVVDAARHATSHHQIDHFVIVADPDYHAIGIYESVGFKPRERVAGALLKPAGR